MRAGPLNMALLTISKLLLCKNRISVVLFLCYKSHVKACIRAVSNQNIRNKIRLNRHCPVIFLKKFTKIENCEM